MTEEQYDRLELLITFWSCNILANIVEKWWISLGFYAISIIAFAALWWMRKNKNPQR